MGIDNNFWKNKKIFITGHTGFKGSWLSLWLQSLGADLTGYSLEPNTEPNLYDVAGVENGMKSIIGDITTYEKLNEAIMSAKPEIVFHMAAQPLVRYSYENTIETFSTNVLGTVNLLESIRYLDSVKAVVNITTDKCYENKEWVWSYRENEPMGGHDPYSSSKGCAELVTSSFRRSFFSKDTYDLHGVALASVRAGNVIGGGDWSEDRLLPDLFKSINNNKSIKIRNPDSVRPWQHVLEPLSGYIQLAQKLFNDGMKYAEAWNFGPESSDMISVLDVIKKIDQYISKEVKWEIDSEKNVHEANLLMLDISKVKKQLKWKPLMTIDESLKRTAEWEEAFNNKQNMRDFTLNQIDRYQALSSSN